MKKTILVLLSLVFTMNLFAQDNEKQEISDLLDSWHQAAANNDLETYFDKIDDDGIYIGTDSSEIWTRQAFYEWSIPYFQQQKGWTFSAVNRNIYLSADQNTAWFDELLKYGNGTLRGSGVLIKHNKDWRIIHYVLSIPVPNDKYKEVMKLIRSQPILIENRE